MPPFVWDFLREKALYFFFLDRRNSPNAPPAACRPSLRLEGDGTECREGDVDVAVGLCIEDTMVALRTACYCTDPVDLGR